MAAGGPLPRLTLVLGGARAGKSRHAEALAEAAGLDLVYLATAEAGDAEMAERIRLHRERRDARWRVVEEPLDLAGCLVAEAATGRVVLVDCLTLWLTNVMLAGRDPAVETERLVAALGRLAGPAILVANEVGLGIVPDNALARAFRDAAGRLNQQVAAIATRVVFVAAGLPLVMKEEPPRKALFDSYVIVDWSAAVVPRLGKDSIWFCHLKLEGGRLVEAALENPATRHAARDRLLGLLREEAAAGRAVLVGFDFPFGYSSGFAARLGLKGSAWRATWNEIARLLEDDGLNRNNRFAVASALNERVTGGPAPFWACPAGVAGPCLGPKHHRRHEAEGIAERRLTEHRVKGPQPVWKLAGAGSVGGQALTGIPTVRALRDDPVLAASAQVWPFETGLAAPSGGITFAEIYPSLVKAEGHPVKDAAQVKSLARHFADLDDRGELAAYFAGDPDLAAEERARVIEEEGWILGVRGFPAIGRVR